MGFREEWGLDEPFLASIRYWNGNYTPAYVRPLYDAPRPVYEVVIGHRRWAACVATDTLFWAVVLPLDVSEADVARLVEDNSTQRHRSEITRTREALVALPRMREELAARRRRGRGNKLDEDSASTTLNKVLSETFFGDLGRGHDHVRKLIRLVETSEGAGPWFETVPGHPVFEDDDMTTTQRELRKLAGTLVAQLDRAPEDSKTALSVRAAYERLETRYHTLSGIPIPGDTRDEVDKRRAWERAADVFERDWTGSKPLPRRSSRGRL